MLKWISAWGLCLLAACTSLVVPKSITLDEQELQRLVERRFPQERRLLEVLDVTVETPRMRVLSERHKVSTALEVRVRDRLFGRQWQARMALDSVMRYEPVDQTLRLRDVRVNEFMVDDGRASSSAQAERVSSLLAEKLLEDMVIYRLPADKLEQLRRLGVAPGAVSVTSRGVEITLVAATN
jgi:hypothetical protein